MQPFTFLNAGNSCPTVAPIQPTMRQLPDNNHQVVFIQQPQQYLTVVNTHDRQPQPTTVPLGPTVAGPIFSGVGPASGTYSTPLQPLATTPTAHTLFSAHHPQPTSQHPPPTQPPPCTYQVARPPSPKQTKLEHGSDLTLPLPPRTPPPPSSFNFRVSQDPMQVQVKQQPDLIERPRLPGPFAPFHAPTLTTPQPHMQPPTHLHPLPNLPLPPDLSAIAATHIDSGKEESRKPTCKVCKKEFSSNTSVKVHMRIHTGEKPFQCQVCSRKFNQKSSLKRHSRVHTGEQPYQCNQCGRRFSDRTNMKKHARIHFRKRSEQTNESRRGELDATVSVPLKMPLLPPPSILSLPVPPRDCL